MTSAPEYTVLRCALVLAFACYVVLQARKPDKWFGRIFARAMNKSHSAMTAWGLAKVTIESHYHILDVGCGGGRTIEKLAAMAAQVSSTGSTMLKAASLSPANTTPASSRPGALPYRRHRFRNCHSLTTRSIL